MFSIPDPLHPAIVHFPIVLLLLGGVVALASVFLNRWHLPWRAAALLVFGTIGAFVAVETGESAQEVVGELPPAVEQLLEEHEEWAERTEFVAGIAAVLAVVAAALGSFIARRGALPPAAEKAAAPKSTIAGAVSLPTVAFGARILTAAAALLACDFIYETGHRGGKLVYDHGVGVKDSAAQAPADGVFHRDDD